METSWNKHSSDLQTWCKYNYSLQTGSLNLASPQHIGSVYAQNNRSPEIFFSTVFITLLSWILSVTYLVQVFQPKLSSRFPDLKWFFPWLFSGSAIADALQLKQNLKNSYILKNKQTIPGKSKHLPMNIDAITPYFLNLNLNQWNMSHIFHISLHIKSKKKISPLMNDSQTEQKISRWTLSQN